MLRVYAAYICLLLSLPVSAQELAAYFGKNNEVEAPAELACVFKNPLVFGASVSAGYSETSDGVIARIEAAKGAAYRPQWDTPVSLMQKKYFGRRSETNIAEVVADVMPHRGSGYAQLRELMSDKKSETKIDEASVLVSFDSFFWQASRGGQQCEYALNDIDSIIRLAQQKKKPLILGNVPNEDPQRVSGMIKLAANAGWAKPHTWARPKEECLTKINSKLKDSCLKANNCHLLDLHTMVKNLNGDGIWFEQQQNRIPNFRFDGLHLKPAGKRYVAHLMAESLTSKLPPCAVRPANGSSPQMAEASGMR